MRGSRGKHTLLILTEMDDSYVRTWHVPKKKKKKKKTLEILLLVVEL